MCGIGRKRHVKGKSREIDPHKYAQLIFYKSAKTIK